jgi:hypothetical protein
MRFRLRTLMILVAAVPIWGYLITIVSQSPGFGILGVVVAPLVLISIAGAIYRMTKPLPDGLAIAILLSPIIALGSLLAIAAVNRQ